MIVLEGVKKQYDGFSLDCSLRVKENQITGIIGTNGAGKTTIFKAILGLIQTDGGTISLFGTGNKEITVKQKKEIGVVLGNSTFPEELKVCDVIPIMKLMYDKFDENWFLKKCKKYNVPKNKKIKDFSTGMKAKFKLLIAMSYQAKLLILDEPTAGLDPVVRSELVDELREYMEVEGRSIVISSHISSDLEGLCDDLYFIKDGTIVFHEDCDVILSNYATLKVDESQYKKMDKQYIRYKRRESYGYSLLTSEKQFYMENYPGIVAERGSIDDIMVMMLRGEAV